MHCEFNLYIIILHLYLLATAHSTYDNLHFLEKMVICNKIKDPVQNHFYINFAEYRFLLCFYKYKLIVIGMK